MTTVSTERELFEAWAVTESFNIDRHYDDAGGEYHRATTRWAWMAWQAARSADTSGARWLPVETAPKDGAEFLAVWGRQGNIVQVVKWNRLHRFWQVKGEPEIGFLANATGWHPLPKPPPAALGGPAEARRPDENSPSGPSDRALNPQPEAVDHERGAP